MKSPCAYAHYNALRATAIEATIMQSKNIFFFASFAVFFVGS